MRIFGGGIPQIAGRVPGAGEIDEGEAPKKLDPSGVQGPGQNGLRPAEGQIGDPDAAAKGIDPARPQKGQGVRGPGDANGQEATQGPGAAEAPGDPFAAQDRAYDAAAADMARGERAKALLGTEGGGEARLNIDPAEYYEEWTGEDPWKPLKGKGDLGAKGDKILAQLMAQQQGEGLKDQLDPILQQQRLLGVEGAMDGKGAGRKGAAVEDPQEEQI